jgi:hypothetical protein
MLAFVGLRLTPVTDTGFTVTAQLAVKPPSLVLTVIVAVPTLVALTRPAEETVATVVLELVHVSAVFVALLGAMTAFT